MLEEYLKTLSFEPDQFQVEGIKEVNDGKNVMVAAPTGAGKTVVGEAAIFRIIKLDSKGKVFYTTPIKALSNQKYNDLVKTYGELKVGLITGDTVINSEAQIVVMTTEVLRNMIYANSKTLENLRTVIFDEIHYLADINRGSVWEEVLIHLSKNVQVVALSATVSNSEEFCDWLSSICGECKLVISEKRPIELEQFIALADDSKAGKGGAKLHDLFVDGSVNSALIHKMRKPFRKDRDRRPKGRRGVGRGFPNAKKSWGGRIIPSRVSIIEALNAEDKLPAIYFIFSRKGCDDAVWQVYKSKMVLTNEGEKNQINHLLKTEIEEKISLSDLETLNYEYFKKTVLSGVAAHHAGLIQIFKEMVEKLFEQGLIKVVFATETLALGVNMPARTVVIEKLTKYNGIGHIPLTPGEFTQLTGRAGRRGKDTKGYSVVVDGKDLQPFDVAALVSRRVYPLKSSFMPSYNMAVNLLKESDIVWAKSVLRKSFAQFQTDLKSKELQRKIDDYKVQLISIKEFLEFDTNGKPLKPNSDDKEKNRKSKFIGRWYKTVSRIEENEKELKKSRMRLEVEFDKICKVLIEYGYLKKDGENLTVTKKGEILSFLNCEHELLLSELILSGILNDLHENELAATLSALVSVSKTVPFKSVVHNQHQKQLKNALFTLNSIFEQIRKSEKRLNVQSSRASFEPNFSLIEPIYDHCCGASLETVSLSFNKDVLLGDFIRCLRNTIDICSQIFRNFEDERLQTNAYYTIEKLKTGIITLLD